MDLGVDVCGEAGDDAGGLAFDVYLEDWLDFAGSDDGARDVRAGDTCERCLVDGGALGSSDSGDAESENDDDDSDRDPDDAARFLSGSHVDLYGSPVLVVPRKNQAYLRRTPRTLP